MLTKPLYCINGRFLTRQITGVDRYAREIVRELDSLLNNGEAILLLPEDQEPIDWEVTDNIVLRRYGRHSGHAWEQIDLARYIYKHKLLGVNLCNTAPIFNPGVVCIHDMAVRANVVNYSRKFLLWYRFLYSQLTRRAKKILTVSAFSKSEIEKFYPQARGKIVVAPNAWQHVNKVEEAPEILEKYRLTKGGYWFAMSSLAPNKNLRWLVETALLNPDEIVVIAGGVNSKIFRDHDIPTAANVKYLGYVSDGEAKALMGGCKGFLFPTFYEGFGIPPMEAMASGADCVLVSDSPCMHNIYGEAVTYIDPYKPESNLKNRLVGRHDQIVQLLLKYSWLNTANLLLDAMENVRDNYEN